MEKDVVAALRLEFLNQDEVRRQIEIRAYEFFLERGCQHGHHERDWLRAEQEVIGPLIRERMQLAGTAVITDAIVSEHRGAKPRKTRTAKTPNAAVRKAAGKAGSRATSKAATAPALAKAGKTKATAAKTRKNPERNPAGILEKSEAITSADEAKKNRTRPVRTAKAAGSALL